MSKTPEQMADEFAKGMAQRDISMPGTSYREESCLRIGYLAGYQAAQPQWISVKERLPIFRLYDQNNESGYTEDVLMRFVWGRIRISNFEKVDGVVSTSYGNGIDDVTHWMPLPKPLEKKDK